MDDPTMVSFFYGPVVLAGKLGRDGMPATDIGGHSDNEACPPFPVPFLVSESPSAAVQHLRPNPAGSLEFTATMTHPQSGQPVEVHLAPFHQVHHQRYAVYWKILQPGDVAAYLANQADTLAAATAFIGNPEAEKSRNFQGENTTAGAFSGRNWRDAHNGGWFSYRLPAASGDDHELVCT